MLVQLKSLSSALILFQCLLFCHAGNVQIHGKQLRPGRYVHPNPLLRPADNHLAISSSRSSANNARIRDEFFDLSRSMRDWVTSSQHTVTLDSLRRLEADVHAHELAVGSLLDSPSGMVTNDQLSQFHFDLQNFVQWLNDWFNTPDAINSPDAVQLLEFEVSAYQGFLAEWLNKTMPSSSSTAAPEASVTSSSTGLPADTGGSADSATDTGSVVASTSPVSTDATTTFVSFDNSATSASDSGIFTPTTEVTTDTATDQPLSTDASSDSAIDSASSQPTPTDSVTDGSSISADTSSTTSPDMSTPDTSSDSSAPSASSVRRSSFNPAASDNVAVYFGQTDRTAQVPLSELCAENSIDVIVLSFLTQFFGAGGYPAVNFGGSGAGISTPQMNAAGASGLAEYNELKNNISQCQEQGKVILLSLGGSTGNTVFGTDDATADKAGSRFADMLWKLFGPPTPDALGMRPFKEVVVDGFDIVDNETNLPKGYTAFTNRLRTLTASHSSRTYYLSASPQCPYPDASIPMSTLQQLDFVWVQFYNNPQCNLGTPGFLPSLRNWSEQLANRSTAAVRKGRMASRGGNRAVKARQLQGSGPRLYVGAFGWQPSDGETGFLEAKRVPAIVTEVASMNLSNLGGWALWDGSEAVGNGEYQRVVKQALKERVGGSRG